MQVYFCNISEISVKFIPNALESSFVRIQCILKYGHKLLLFQYFDPIQIAFAFPKLGLNPVYLKSGKPDQKLPLNFSVFHLKHYCIIHISKATIFFLYMYTSNISNFYYHNIHYFYIYDITLSTPTPNIIKNSEKLKHIIYLNQCIYANNNFFNNILKLFFLLLQVADI